MTNERLFVGTIGEGLWRSLDSGKTFARMGDGIFVECHVRALLVHPENPLTIYVGTELGIFHTTDGGDSWRRLPPPVEGKQIWSLCFLRDNPRVMFAGACPSALFRSEDGGETWQEIKIPFRTECPRIWWTRVTTVTADPVDRNIVWTGVEIDGAWKSEDAGLTWEVHRLGLSSQDIHCIVIVPDPVGKRLIASTNNDLNLSTNNGGEWHPLNLAKVLPHPYFRGMAQKADDPRTIFLGNGDAPPGTIGTVCVSRDAGRNWTRANLPAAANSTIWTFATHAANPDIVYSCSVSGELYRSIDAGQDWQKFAREFGEIRALAWTP